MSLADLCSFIFSEIWTEGQHYKAKPQWAYFKPQTVYKMFCVIMSVYPSFCTKIKLKGDCNFWPLTLGHLSRSYQIMKINQHLQIKALRAFFDLLPLFVELELFYFFTM